MDILHYLFEDSSSSDTINCKKCVQLKLVWSSSQDPIALQRSLQKLEAAYGFSLTGKHWRGGELINPQKSPLRILLDVTVTCVHRVTNICTCLWCAARSVSLALYQGQVHSLETGLVREQGTQIPAGAIITASFPACQLLPP